MASRLITYGRSVGRWNLAAAVFVLLSPSPVFAQSSALHNPRMFSDAPNIEYERNLDCIARAIVYEAGREPLEGQQAVAQVIMNRSRTSAYPKTVCGVVYQGSNRRTGCQFTFTCDGSLARRMPERMFLTARAIAEAALDGTLPDRVGAATHYHADYVLPYWASGLKRVGQIGAHIFYRSGVGMQGRRETPSSEIMPPANLSSLSNRQDASRPFSPWGLPLLMAEAVPR